MMFSNKSLILVCPFSERTYYRRVKSLKEKEVFVKQTEGDLLTLEEAVLIAEKLGFKKEFLKFIETSGKH